MQKPATSPFEIIVRLVLDKDGVPELGYRSSSPDMGDLIAAAAIEVRYEIWPMLPGSKVGLEMRFLVGVPPEQKQNS